ncbi:VENN motif pre-toxin domain-containing protein [Pasteurella multocida]|nr:VENN motif pre-toxin domain-containing protein [Pasteurella multocida]
MAKKALAQAEQTGNQTEITQKQTALFAAEEAQAKWGDKGEYKRTAERLTTLLTGILAKQAAGGIATQLLSPEVNQWIKEATTNDKGETDKIANTLAHAIWGAIEATANRGNPTSGAIAAASAELAAPMLAKVLYNKDKAEYLTAEEKAQITALSSMTAAVAGGLTAQGSSQSNTTVSSLTHASIGGEIGKVAVENNYLAVLSRGCLSISFCRNQVLKEALLLNSSVIATSIIAEELTSKLSSDESEHLMTLLLIGNDNITSHYVNSLVTKYASLDPNDVPKVEGYPIPEPKKPLILVSPQPEYDREDGILITPTHITDKHDSVLVGGEIKIGDWRDIILTKDNRLPIPDPIIAINGLKIESNPKHTPGTSGYGRKAGTEPRNSRELFEKSISTLDPLIRLSIDDQGNIHRFTNSNKKGETGKDIYHWTGSTGDKSSPMT